MPSTPDAPLSEQDLAAIRGMDTPTIANALELTGIRPWTEGFTRPEVKCMFPDMGTTVGYAVTLEIASRVPGRASVPRPDYWDAIVAQPAPRVIVIHDRDYPDVIGSFWGEVQANIAKGLGCVGTVTDGGVRDLDEARALGFQFHAKEVLVSHAYVDVESLGGPVNVGGFTVSPGDLIAADKHGAIQIPLEVARDLPKLKSQLEEYEAVIINAAQQPVVTPDTLRAAAEEQSRLRQSQQHAY
ncbi:MAG: RraA family protein [Chloroflexota bacterium]